MFKMRDPDMSWFRDHVGEAKAVMIGPRILQAGAQESEMVALIMTDKALNSLLSTSFKIGGDVSVAAGPIGVGTADYGRAATPVDILVTHSVSNPYGASLVRMVSHAVAEGR
ncbi:YSC84-related protein [Massilia sp. 2TAF26]|uniref:YSC84-related protein n=1 Tax=Massilia sp. 2TAF26 TaxID=3233012 RepID=UPI003F9E8A2F